MSQLAHIDSIMADGSKRPSITNNERSQRTTITTNGDHHSYADDLEKSRQSLTEKYKDLLQERIKLNPSISSDRRNNNSTNNNTYNDEITKNEPLIYKQFKESLRKKSPNNYETHGHHSNYDDLDYLDQTDEDYTDQEQTFESEDDENLTLDPEADRDEESLIDVYDDLYPQGPYDEKSSFLYEEDDSSDSGEYYEGEEYDHDDNNQGERTNIYSKKFILMYILIAFGIFYFIRVGSDNSSGNLLNKNNGTNSATFYSNPNSGSLTNIQKQINHLYNELSTRDKRWNNEFDEKLKIIISQFEKNIKRLLPSNLLNFEKEINSINSKIKSLQESNSKVNKEAKFRITLANVTDFQNKLIDELDKELPKEIPVMVNNSSSILIIPELHNYISHLLSNVVKYANITMDKSSTSSNNKTPLDYDLNNYIKEILTNEFQYIDKDFFIRELNSKLQNNKKEILHDLQDNIQMELIKFNNNKMLNQQQQQQHDGFPERYSTVLLKRLINQIYDVNQHQWGDDLDFMTFSQGTRLLKSLTSANSGHGNGMSPMQLLLDTKLDSTSTYWQCQLDSKGQSSVAIRFKNPLHLTKISYLHGRFTNNLHMMNSAPRKISIYIKLTNGRDTMKLHDLAAEYNEGQFYQDDKSFIKIQTYEYNIFGPKIKQTFLLPHWFIQFKPLVKAMIFEINENYGNKDYTSLKKFVVNGVTESDLSILKSKSFPMYDYKNNETAIPEYHYDYTSEQIKQYRNNNNNVRKLQEPDHNRHTTDKKKINNIPSFGEDQPV